MRSRDAGCWPSASATRGGTGRAAMNTEIHTTDLISAPPKRPTRCATTRRSSPPRGLPSRMTARRRRSRAARAPCEPRGSARSTATSRRGPARGRLGRGGRGDDPLGRGRGRAPVGRSRRLAAPVRRVHRHEAGHRGGAAHVPAEDSDVLQGCPTAITETGESLLRRAQMRVSLVTIRPSPTVPDGRQIAAMHNSDPEQIDRILEVALEGLRYRPSA